MKTATNIYIFNLALADALVTTTMPFQSTDYMMNTWPFGEVVCKVFISIDYYNMFISIFTLTMMSVDRYVAVCHPVKALDFRTPVKAKVINVCIWILSSAAGIPAFVLGGTQTKSGEEELFLSQNPQASLPYSSFYTSSITMAVFKRLCKNVPTSECKLVFKLMAESGILFIQHFNNNTAFA